MKIETQFPASRAARSREMTGRAAALTVRAIMGTRFEQGAATVMAPPFRAF